MMSSGKQRPDGAGDTTSTAAASSGGGSSLGSFSSAPVISGVSSSDAAEIADLQKRGQWVSAIDLLSGLIQSQSDGRSSPPPLSLIIIRACCFFRLDEYNAALADCDTVLSLKSRDVEVNSLRFKCLLGLRRYDEAASEIRKLSKRDEANETTHFKSLLELWRRVEKERAGTFDVAAMMEETLSLVTPNREQDSDDDDGDEGSNGCDLSILEQSVDRPAIRLGPHADYLHPSVECAVAIEGKGRGTRVRASASSSTDSTVASSSSSSSSSSAASSSSSTASSSASLLSGSLPKHSLVMSMKAIAVNLRSDMLGNKAMLLRKLNDQPHLIAQVLRLFGLQQYESDRRELLLTEGAEAVWKHPATAPSPESLAEVNDTRFRLTATLRQNPFGDSLGWEWRSRGVGGSALFFLPSFFNHSCVPNCHWTLIGDQIFIRAVRDVAAGEELTISYRGSLVDRTFSFRQNELQSTWSFTCSCEFCAPYALHSKLEEHEAQSCSTRVILHCEFNALPSSELTKRIAVTDSLRSLIADHSQFISDLPNANVRLLEASMRQHWATLSAMLSDILLCMPQSDARFPALLQRHRDACEQRALISARWDCELSGWVVSQLDRLRQQVKAPAHATMTIAQQESTMRDLIRQFAAHHGFECGTHFLTRHRSDLISAGLTAMYHKCLAQIATEDAAAKGASTMDDE